MALSLIASIFMHSFTPLSVDFLSRSRVLFVPSSHLWTGRRKGEEGKDTSASRIDDDTSLGRSIRAADASSRTSHRRFIHWSSEAPSAGARVGMYCQLAVTAYILSVLSLGGMFLASDYSGPRFALIVSLVLLTFLCYAAAVSEVRASDESSRASNAAAPSLARSYPAFTESFENRPGWLKTATGFLLVVSDALPLVLVAAVALYVWNLFAMGFGDSAARPADLLDLLAIAAVSGLCSCATLEAAKRLLRLRGLYQHRQIRLWLASAAGNHAVGKAAIMELLKYTGVLTQAEFQRFLVHGRPSRSAGTLLEGLLLFDLPVEQLTAQISDALEAALQNPAKYPALYASMVDKSIRPDRLTSDTKTDRGLEALVQGRLSIDRLQISVGNRWRRYISGAALGLSGLVGLNFWQATGAPGDVIVASLVVTFAGGFISWFLRDLAAGIERWRREVG